MRRFAVFLVLIVALGGGYWWFALRTPPVAATAAGGRPAPAVPVVVAQAERRDVAVYLDGLGTVQASALVTVKPMVDGPLREVLFKEGQDVTAGEVLARIDPRPFRAALDQAEARKRQDEATLANARIDLARYEKLAATAYTSAQQADTQKTLVAQLVAQVAQDQAQIDTAATQLSYTTVTSPIDGRAGIRQVDAGNIVHASDPNGLVVVTTLRPINVQFTLPQQSLPRVQAAMAAGSPEVLALVNGAPPEHGTLTVLDNQVDPATGTIKLKARFPNPNLRLWPGAFVTVRLRAETLKGAVVVPPVAVQRGPLGPFVYVVGADGVAKRTAVTEGHEDLDWAVIDQGLAAGARVVVDGAARVSDGTKVSILPAASGPGAAPAPAG